MRRTLLPREWARCTFLSAVRTVWAQCNLKVSYSRGRLLVGRWCVAGGLRQPEARPLGPFPMAIAIPPSRARSAR
eukprot:SAG11_NODE_3466_length_2431_cov_1.517153_4_plen_75_part_00